MSYLDSLKRTYYCSGKMDCGKRCIGSQHEFYTQGLLGSIACSSTAGNLPHISRILPNSSCCKQHSLLLFFIVPLNPQALKLEFGPCLIIWDSRGQRGIGLLESGRGCCSWWHWELNYRQWGSLWWQLREDNGNSFETEFFQQSGRLWISLPG